MSERVSDFAMLIGHVWRCPDCRDLLVNQPENAWIGYKLSEEQREAIRNLRRESFSTVMRLSDALELSSKELYAAIDHPRARLRHLGVLRGEYRFSR